MMVCGAHISARSQFACGKMTTILTFPVFLMVNKRVYPFSHKRWKPMESLSFTSTTTQLWGQWCGTRQLAPTHSITVTAAEFSFTTVSLSSHCFLPPTHEAIPLSWESVNVNVSETPPQHHPLTTFYGLLHSTRRSWASLRKQCDPSALKNMTNIPANSCSGFTYSIAQVLIWKIKKNKMHICIHLPCLVNLQ